MEPQTFKGTVLDIRQKEKNYAVKVKNETNTEEFWLSDFGQCPYKKDEKIEVQFVVHGDFRNIFKPRPAYQPKIGYPQNNNQLKASALDGAIKLVLSVQGFDSTDAALGAVKQVYRELYKELSSE